MAGNVPELRLDRCLLPFFDQKDYRDTDGFVGGRLCAAVSNTTICCLPCPMTDWVYPDSFLTLTLAVEIISVVSTACCVFLLLSWAFLPVEKTYRHYLSICLTIAVTLMNLGFVIPLAAQPAQCADDITPHDMRSSRTCGASGTFIILGGWAGVMWVFLRSLSLHLQICWQVVVGKSFMWWAQIAGWGVPAIGISLALSLSGVSFRFGASCHINHQNSLAVLWIPLLVFAGFTIVIQFATFGYCIKVYLASLSDNNASTEGSSSLPTYTNSVQSLSPRQAYRRIRRVIALQWRGIAIVLIIIADVIFFSIVFVFQDNTLERLKTNREDVLPWLSCLIQSRGDKNQCLGIASKFVLSQATTGAVLILLGMNGIWLLLLLGRWSMVTGWADLVASCTRRKHKAEFVSVDARLDDFKKETRSYEMLSRDSGKTMADDEVTPSAGTPVAPSPAVLSPTSPTPSGRRTPDYFGQTARYHTPARSFSAPRTPARQPQNSVRWDPSEMYVKTSPVDEDGNADDGRHDGRHDYGHGSGQRGLNPSGMNRI